MMSSSVTAGNQKSLIAFDDNNQKVEVNYPAQRVMSLSPHLTELLFEIGAGERIVATVDYSDYPQQAQSIPRLGRFDTVSIESILAFKPDLILAWSDGTPQSVITRIKAFNIPIYVSDPSEFNDISNTMIQLGTLLGLEKEARKQASLFDKKLNAIKQKYSLENFRSTDSNSLESHILPKPVKVMYQVWDSPLMTLNNETYISKVMALCGGHNVFGDVTIRAPQIGIESVILADPDIIIFSEADAIKRREFWKRFPSIKAVKNDAFITVKDSLLSRPTSRLLEGAQELCEKMMPYRVIN